MVFQTQRFPAEGRKLLAYEIILACADVMEEVGTCTLSYRVEKDKPITLSIGNKMLFCDDEGDAESC